MHETHPDFAAVLSAFKRHGVRTPNESPRHGNQFFGHAAIDGDGLLTVSLRDLHGTTLWSKDLAPAH